MPFLTKEMQHLKESAESLLHGKHEGSGVGKHGAAGSAAPADPAAAHAEGAAAGAGAAVVPQIVHAHNTLHAETIPTYT